MNDVAVLRQMARITHQVVRINTDGLTHEESLVQPQPGGNCLNWVLGHLQHVNEQVLVGLGQEPVLGVAAVQRYERGSEPLTEGGEALPLETLLAAWDESATRIDAGLASLTEAQLDGPAPPQFGRNLREMYGFVCFHQAYHAGQTAVLRRLVGKEGAVK